MYQTLLRRGLGACVALTILGAEPSPAQPQVYRLGLAVTSRIDTTALPRHLNQTYAQSLYDLRSDLHAIFRQMGRFRVRNTVAVPTEDDYTYTYSDPDRVDYIAHVELVKFYKIFRNRVIRYLNQDFDFSAESQQPYEVYSMPAIEGRLAVKIIDVGRDKVIWSAQRDSTVVVPYDDFTFIYNLSKYPGWTHQALIRAHLADLLRLQDAHPTAGRMLQVADRWYISRPGDDIETSAVVLDALLEPLFGQIDANLPLEGRIAAVLPQRKGKQYARVDIGADHGLSHKLRLDVWRPLPSEQKVGQVEVVQLDSTTAVVRLRKLEKKLRKSGQSFMAGDRVISKKRSSLRRRDSL